MRGVGREEGSFLGEGHTMDFARLFRGFWEEGVHLLRLDLEFQTEWKAAFLSLLPTMEY